MSYLPRGQFTQYLLDTLATAEVLVGDAEAASTGGWDNDPNAAGSSYTPYVSLYPMPVAAPTGPLADSNADFQAPYSVTSYGISRAQCEFYADKVRSAFDELALVDITLDAHQWKLQLVNATSIGGIQRDDGTEPSEFSQTDVYMCYLSKEL